MLPARQRSYPERVIMDYESPHGPNVTEVRGILLVNSLELLKQAGHYERYLTLFDDPRRDAVLYAIAASWLPVDLAAAHYRACDRLELEDHELNLMGQMTAKRVAETFLGTVLRTSRKAGVESYWFVVKQSDRLWDRAFRGGGCTVLQTGPKDVTVEWHGLPLVRSRHFRAGQRFYSQALAQLFCATVFVRNVPPREPHQHRLATAVSWV